MQVALLETVLPEVHPSSEIVFGSTFLSSWIQLLRSRQHNFLVGLYQAIGAPGKQGQLWPGNPGHDEGSYMHVIHGVTQAH
jgi:hypothetical protein